jgi:8-oxo-dGTP pyrophosphatase MutT (NUDIX family)
MLKKIYFNNKPLFLTDQITPETEEYIHREDAVYIDELSGHSVRTMIYEMLLPRIYGGVFYYKDVDAVLRAFKKELAFIQAAGGFLHSGKDSILMIFRRGKWDLPKGKLDDNESLETCAVREVKEETGLVTILPERRLCITYHTYFQEGKHILKETHWYLMSAYKNEPLSPQTEEDIDECKWVSVNDISYYISHTHASIAEVIKVGVKALELI